LLAVLSSSVSASWGTDLADDIIDLICELYWAFIYVAGALAALIFVASGVAWIVSQDDPARRNKARDWMIHAVMGLILVGATYVIVSNVSDVDTTYCEDLSGGFTATSGGGGDGVDGGPGTSGADSKGGEGEKSWVTETTRELY